MELTGARESRGEKELAGRRERTLGRVVWKRIYRPGLPKAALGLPRVDGAKVGNLVGGRV
jgi:hypothetical protein